METIHLNKNTEHVREYLEKLVLAVEKVLIELHPEKIESWKKSLCDIRLYISDIEKIIMNKIINLTGISDI